MEKASAKERKLRVARGAANGSNFLILSPAIIFQIHAIGDESEDFLDELEEETRDIIFCRLGVSSTLLVCQAELTMVTEPLKNVDDSDGTQSERRLMISRKPTCLNPMA